VEKNVGSVVVQDGGGAVVKDDSCFFFCRKDGVGSRMGA
jgi:hypothetical protein